MKNEMIRAEASRIIHAPPQEVYAVISDYRVGHPAILPKPYFTDLVVEQGGQGAGTVIRVVMKVMGQTFRYHQTVTEPEPGRLLVETDIDTGQYSTFALEPLDDGKRTRITIASYFPQSPGLKGLMERLFTPSITRRIFEQELRNLEDYLRQDRSGSAPPH